MTKIFKTPFGALGDKQEVPTPTQSDGSVSYEQGFGVDYQRDYEDPQAKDIPREGLNQLFYDITKALGELQKLGYMQWQAGEYQAGERVAEGGVAYKAVRATSNKPPHADWDLIPDKSLEIISQSEAENGLSTELSGWTSERVRQNAKKYTDSVALGVGQLYKSVASSRDAGVTYTNSTSKPIAVSITCSAAQWVILEVNGVGVSDFRGSQTREDAPTLTLVDGTVFAIVPSGSTYRARNPDSKFKGYTKWSELSQ